MSESIASNRRIAKNTLLLYVRMGISMLVSLYTARIVISALGEMDYGILNIVSGCVAIFTFLNGSLSGSASRFLTFELGRNNIPGLNKIFNASLAVHIFVAVILIVLCETAGLWILNEKLIIPADRMLSAQWAYQISIVLMVFSLVQVPYGAVVIAHEKMDIYAYLSILDIVLRLSLAFLLQIINGDKLIIWSIMTLIITIIYTSVYVIYCRRKFAETVLQVCRESLIYKQLFSFSLWNLIGSISGMLQNQGLNILLNMFFGPVINTARAISYQIQGTLTQFSGNFMLATKPQIIKLYACGQTKEMMSLVRFSACLAFYLTWVFTLPVSLELPYLLDLWLKEYPNYTISFSLLTLILSLILSIKTSRTTATLATGNIKATNLTVCIILCMTFPISYLLLHYKFSPNSVVVVTIMMTFLGEIVAVGILKRYVQFSMLHYFITVYGRCFLVAIVSGVLPFLVHYLFEVEGFVRLVLVSLTSIMSVGLTIYFIGFTRQNRAKLTHELKRMLKKHRNSSE